MASNALGFSFHQGMIYVVMIRLMLRGLGKNRRTRQPRVSLIHVYKQPLKAGQPVISVCLDMIHQWLRQKLETGGISVL